MKTLKNNALAIVVLLFELVVGILLLVEPEEFTTLIVMICGIVLLASGVMEVIRYFREQPETAEKEQTMAKGLCMLLGGGFCLLRTNWFVETFTVLTAVYEAKILLAGLVKVQWTVDMLRLKLQSWYIAAITAVVTLACGVVVLLNPFASLKVLWMFMGIALLVEAAADVVTLVFRVKAVADQKKAAAKK